ncbi:MAG: alpha-glucosidase C-terminal domain-containing protein [Chitinophagaceae bacterium]|nr:alpha-glucosidase C-terminal domain-containing protein [Chitinophagaceae bacterium]
MKSKFSLWLPALILATYTVNGQDHPSNNFKPSHEIIYHVVQRSFYDSNGDLNGDLNGLREKLGYLQELGATSILLLPLYQSPYYHNYFADNFEKIDSTFGTMQDYLNLVREVHRRGMKIYMDMETQYVTEDHEWYKDSYGNLSSPYSDFIAYDDSAHTKPSSIVYDLHEFTGYNGITKKLTTVNMNSKKVLDYNISLFSHWVDPNGDGNFNDGVDGFRLDHMMDNLDNKNRWSHLFQNFWSPLIQKVRSVNPKIIFIAEQANWSSFGIDYLKEAGVDRVFAFRIAFEIRNLNKKKLETVCDSTFRFTPTGKNQIVFIENHDMPRFASVVNHNPGKLRVGAVLNLLLGGIPSIYYGQELGMYGGGKSMEWGMTDGNEIPEREAFEWYKSDTGKGMAFWYRDTGPWWTNSNDKPNDGISLQEEKADPNSLWRFYRNLILFRESRETLRSGTYYGIKNNNDSVFTFLRILNDKADLIAVNFSSKSAKAELDMQSVSYQKKIKKLFGNGNVSSARKNTGVQLPPYGFVVYELKNFKHN